MRWFHRSCMVRVVVTAVLFVTAAMLLVPRHGAAAPNDAPPQSTESWGTTDLPADRQALDACIDVTEFDQHPGIDPSTIDARLRKPGNRVEGLDLSGQDLTGWNFSGQVLIDVKYKGARLHGVDLTEAIICRSDLTNADRREDLAQ